MRINTGHLPSTKDIRRCTRKGKNSLLLYCSPLIVYPLWDADGLMGLLQAGKAQTKWEIREKKRVWNVSIMGEESQTKTKKITSTFPRFTPNRQSILTASSRSTLCNTLRGSGWTCKRTTFFSAGHSLSRIYRQASAGCPHRPQVQPAGKSASLRFPFLGCCPLERKVFLFSWWMFDNLDPACKGECRRASNVCFSKCPKLCWPAEVERSLEYFR